MPRKSKKRCSACKGSRFIDLPDTRLCLACLEAVAPALIRLQHDRSATNLRLLRDFAIDIAMYEKMAIEQAGRCAICQQHPPSERRLAVDHDHETGAIRGLLCSNCNLLLGHAKDQIATLAQAIIYLSGVRS